jgi:hypothetical protein
MLEECRLTAQSLPLGEGYLALANFRLHHVHNSLSQSAKAQTYLKEAVAARDIVRSRNGDSQLDESAAAEEKSYEQLVSWLLW